MLLTEIYAPIQKDLAVVEDRLKSTGAGSLPGWVICCLMP